MKYFIYQNLLGDYELIQQDDQNNETVIATDTLSNLTLQLQTIINQTHRTTLYCYDPTQNAVTNYTASTPAVIDAKTFAQPALDNPE